MKNFLKKYWKFILGVLIGVALLGYFIRLIQWRQVFLELRHPAHPWLILLGTLVGALNFAIRAVRWKYLLLPLKPVRIYSLFKAVCIGFMAITLIPGRVGEFIRAYVLARRERMKTSPVFATVVVERVLDGITLIACLTISLFFFRGGVGAAGGRSAEIMGQIERFSAVGTAALAALLGMMALLVWKPALVGRLAEVCFFFLPEKWRRKLVGVVTSFTEGFSVLSRPKLLLPIAFHSLLCWTAIGLGIWLMLLGFDIRIPAGQIILVVALTAAGVSIPTPAGAGGYHGAMIAGLVVLYGVDMNKATAAATVCHLLSFLPVTLLGAGYAWKEGLSLGAMKAIADDGEGEPGRSADEVSVLQ
jgi:uncharacterized protein (TIRG00374 family)